MINALLICILFAARAHAETAVLGEGRNAPPPEVIVNLDTGGQSYPIPELLGKLFAQTSYKLYMADGVAKSKNLVSVSITNVPFRLALSILANNQYLTVAPAPSGFLISPDSGSRVLSIYYAPAGFRAAVPGGILHSSLAPGSSFPGSSESDRLIAPLEPPSYFSPGSMPRVIPTGTSFSPSVADDYNFISMTIPAMPVNKAVAKIEPGWSFSGNLGKRMMPGAKFVGFPRKLAIMLLLHSAGLIPPADEQKVVTSTGVANLLITWHHLLVAHRESNRIDMRTSGNWVASYQLTPNTGDVRAIGCGAYGIGGYLSGGRWVFTVLSTQAHDVSLLTSLLSTASHRFVMRDPAKYDLTSELSDVTLDQALDIILPSIHRCYNKTGSAQNPVYVIQSTPTKHRVLNDPTKPNTLGGKTAGN
jgi:hypothetical protein